jgi:hypothetical protein
MIPQSDSWIEMKSFSFQDIVQKSLIPRQWGEFPYVLNDYKKDIIKPVNMYAGLFGSAPKLKDIKNNIITLEQYTHSDIYLLKEINKSLYALDKAHQRQFYLSENAYVIKQENFISDECYRFYIPWVIDFDVKCNIRSNNLKSNSFHIIEKEINFKKINNEPQFLNTEFIDFYFTDSKSHMIEEDCGIIEKGSYMYDIVFEADKELIEQIVSFYEK